MSIFTRRQFSAIDDEVEAPTIEKARKEARKKYPNAPELSLLQIGSKNGTTKGALTKALKNNSVAS